MHLNVTGFACMLWIVILQHFVFFLHNIYFCVCVFINVLIKYNSSSYAFLSHSSELQSPAVAPHRRTGSQNAATDAKGVGRECVVETQSPHIGCPLPPVRKQETRGAAVLNNGPAPHQPSLKRPHSVPPALLRLLPGKLARTCLYSWQTCLSLFWTGLCLCLHTCLRLHHCTFSSSSFAPSNTVQFSKAELGTVRSLQANVSTGCPMAVYHYLFRKIA